VPDARRSVLEKQTSAKWLDALHEKSIKMHFVLFVLVLGLLSFEKVSADESFATYLEQKDRFSFAQLYLSGEYISSISATQYQYESSPGLLDRGSLSQIAVPRFTIGGSHFWGYADFYVSFPLANSRNSIDQGSNQVDPGVETGARVFYPQRRPGTFSGFVGLSWNYASYQQTIDNAQGPIYNKSFFPFQMGASYSTKNLMFDLGFQWWPTSEMDYPTSRLYYGKIDLPDKYIWLSTRYIFDTSVGAREGTSSKSKRSSFAGIGISSSFPVGSSSSYLQSEKRFLNTNPTSTLVEYTVGYELSEWNLSVALAFRPMSFKQQAYGVKQVIERDALAIEVFSFLFDYQGFDPFIGLSIGWESIRYSESDSLNQNNSFESRDEDFRLGILFGWDIRPLARTPFVLRTNLRYYPDVKIPLRNGNTYRENHLEFNFIQAVYFFDY